MVTIDRHSGRSYQLLKVYRDTGMCTERTTLRRYDIVKRYIRPAPAQPEDDMTRTPYTTSIATTLGINTDELAALATRGTDNPIGQCAATVVTTVWEMESAERTAREAIASLTTQTEAQAEALAGNGRTFDPSWLTTYARRAEEANTKLAAGTERLRTFKRLLDMLTAQAAA